jgi:N-acetylmuramoyl-L-alanine amidase
MSALTKAQWLRKKRRKKLLLLVFFTSIIMFMLFLVGIMVAFVLKDMNISVFSFWGSSKSIESPKITQMLLTPNEYSRPQTPLKKVKGIVIHYTANPGTGAEANRNYFEGLSENKTTSASSHFVIGLEGEIVQCVPLDEISFASNDRNFDTISIECCHPDATGKFNDATYDSLVKLVAFICCKYNLKEDDIIRHYDVTGKLCPLYFVEHEDEWIKFKDTVMKYIEENAVKN